MPHCFDVVIAGAGLAGASAARALALAGLDVCILEQDRIASGASGGGAGLVSPMMSRKGRPVWGAREALDSLGLPDTGVLRPASSLEQAAYFKESALNNPDLGLWVDPPSARSLFPHLVAPHGILHVLRGCSVDLETLSRRWIKEAESEGATVLEYTKMDDWTEVGGRVESRLVDGKILLSKKLLMATGHDLMDHRGTQHLNLHLIKGQRLQLRKPEGWHESILPVSSSGFILDEGPFLSVGATFEHQWTTDEPTEKGRKSILRQGAEVIPDILEMEITRHWVGFRVTVPGTRMPMVGPITDSGHVWVFTGLGSKGILMSALFGAKIPTFFKSPEAIPKLCRVAYRRAKD